MNHIHNHLKGILLGLMCLPLLVGCSDTTVVIGDGENGGFLPAGRPALITFHATIENRNLTRSMSPILRNVQVQLYAFSAAATNTSSVSTAQGLYQAAAIGQLTGVNNYKMYLPGGTYNFYGVSVNTSSPPPAFDNNLSEPLSNGVDYLWWEGLKQDVATTQVIIPIVLQHRATQIAFEVVPGAGVTIDRLASVRTFAPEEGARMDLSTGVIPPAIKRSSGFDNIMGVNGTIAQSILLPLDNNSPLPALFEVNINGESTTRLFAAEVPIPSGGLQAGYSYRFKVVINTSSAEFPSVNITDWIDVDETGKPIDPTPVYPPQAQQAK